MTTGRALAFGGVLGLLAAVVIAQLYAAVGPDSWPRDVAYAFVVTPLGQAALAVVTAQPSIAHRPISSRVVFALVVSTIESIVLAELSLTGDLGKCTFIPTLACALFVEIRTRNPRAAPRDTTSTAERERTAAIHTAMALGALTTLAAFVTEALTDDPARGLITIVAGAFLPFGLLAGALLGAPFGALAHATRGDAIWVRRLALSTIAAEVVFTLATVTQTRSLLVPALFGTLAGCLYLEQRTRAKPSVPPAAVRHRPLVR